MTDVERLMIDRKPVKCDKCSGKVFHIGGGVYHCESCGADILDDFGKIKRFLDENGPTPILIISQYTGVSTEIIEAFLRQGRVEIPDGSKYYISCERCGCSIRFGRFCPECVQELAGGIKSVFCAEMGERPKREDMSGKMHFLNRGR